MRAVNSGWFCAIFVMALLPACGRGAEIPPAGPIPAELYFQAPSFTLPKLSSDGSHFGALTRFDHRHYALVLIDVGTSRAHVLVKQAGLSVVDYWWKGDDLLLVLTENDHGGQVYVSIDLKTLTQNPLDWLNRRAAWVLHELPSEPNQFLFYSDIGGGPAVQKVNLRTGEHVLVEKSQRGLTGWLTDEQGRLMAGIGFNSDKWFFIWRPSPSQPWQRLEQPGERLPNFDPLAVSGDGRHLLARDRTLGSTAHLVAFDLATGTKEDVFHSDEVDFTGLLGWGVNRVPYAVEYETDREHRLYLNPEAELIQRAIDGALPDTDNFIESFSQNNRRMVVGSVGDRNVGTYYLFDRDKGTLSELGTITSGIPPESLAPSRYFRFTARDGLQVTGRITRPPNVANPPLIVRVGPTLASPRARFGFDAVAQYLASRGYATVRIHTRGTMGYGRDHLLAGDLQMNSGVVHDLEDGVKWLADQGWVNRERVAILGQREGGLAALQAAVRSTAFRVFINFNIPMETQWAEVEALSPSTRKHEDLIAEAGGTKAANTYLKSIDPIAAVNRLTLPSFNYYQRNDWDNAMTLSGRTLETLLKRHHRDYQIGMPAIWREDLDYAKEDAKAYDALVEFLRTRL